CVAGPGAHGAAPAGDRRSGPVAAAWPGPRVAGATPGRLAPRPGRQQCAAVRRTGLARTAAAPAARAAGAAAARAARARPAPAVVATRDRRGLAGAAGHL